MRILLFLFVLLSFQVMAQQEAIDALKQQLDQTTQEGYGYIALELSKLLRSQSEYGEAASYAHQAYLKAEENNDPHLMAHALNHEAKALLSIEPLQENNYELAIRKLKESQRIIRKFDLPEHRLSEKNRILLKESDDGLGLKRKFVDISKVIGMAWDSVVAEIEKLDDNPTVFESEDWSSLQDHDPHVIEKMPPRAYPELPHRKEFIQGILEMNKKKMEREIKSMVQLDDLDSINIKGITIKNLEDLGKVWGVEKGNIEKALVMEENRIRRMDAREAREQLLIAQYKSKYDSLAYLHTVDSLNLAKQEVDLAQRETELKRKELQQQLSSMISGGSSLLFLLFLFGYFRVRKSNKILSEKNKQIEHEQERSEGLLLNILPAEVADELKEYGAAQAHHYDNVSVLFADFQNFSLIAETMSPEQLVSELDYCFKAFDDIIDKYNLEKIKTIGDAYMCAGGLPTPDDENATKAVQAALDMQEFLEAWKEQRMNTNQPFFEARIGIHTGPIVAGVVGVKKFAYDIWGDTVNIASRMEANSEAGQVNISETTYELVKDQFQFTPRGKFKAKNKGEIEMYFVHKVDTKESILELV